MPGVIARRLGLGVVLTVALAGVGTAQQGVDDTRVAPGQGADCTEAEVDYADDPSLTREERIAAMDRALSRSLSKYDACRAAARAGGAAASGDGDGEGADGLAVGSGSVASSDMSGKSKVESTNQPSSATASRAERGGPVDWSTPPSDMETSTIESDQPESSPETAQALENGRIPADIPPADNDSVIEAQIRQAAMNEPDPEIRRKLWNEYRRYKGLPPVE